MLHASLAIEAADHPYWELEGYDEAHRKSFADDSALYLAPDCEALFEEMDKARYDERTDGDPDMAQPETSLDMMDDAIDCLRYFIRGAAERYIRKR
jgi:hypothetical protein